MRQKGEFAFECGFAQKVAHTLWECGRGFIFLRGGGKCANMSVSVQLDFRICRFARSRRVRDRVSVSVLGVTEV